MPSSRKPTRRMIRIHFAKPARRPLRKFSRTSCRISQSSDPGVGRTASGNGIGGARGEVQEHVLERQLVRAGAGPKLGERAFGEQPAAVDNSDPVGEPLG